MPARSRPPIAPVIAALLAVVSLGAAAAPSALAGDPLLSGYAGPGGGEQVVLGSEFIPPANGDGSLRAPSASSRGRAAAPAAPAFAGAAAGTPSLAPAAVQDAPSSSAAAAPDPASADPDVAPLDPPATAAAPAAAPATLAASATTAGPVPLTQRQVMLALGGLALLVACGVATAAMTTGRRGRHA